MHMHTHLQLRRLELLSYEDVSDTELAPLASCQHLQHLYIDSLFIKQVCVYVCVFCVNRSSFSTRPKGCVCVFVLCMCIHLCV
jgi:L-lysine 2,3-aminomutase